MRVRFGFREEPDLPAALRKHNASLLAEDIATTWVVGRSSIADGPGRLPSWRAHVYSAMARHAEDAGSWFRLPPNQIVELGTRVLL